MDCKVSILIPTIRPKGARRCKFYLDIDSSFKYDEILMDEDHERIGCPKMLKKMVEKARNDWVMFLGDDTIPQMGMVSEVFKAASCLPDEWGMVGINDQYHDGNLLATHWMAHKKLLPLLGGEFFHTGYYHTYCDVELIRRCKAMGRYVFAEAATLIHDHPLLKRGCEMGVDYSHIYSEENLRHDLILFKRRERARWPM